MPRKKPGTDPDQVNRRRLVRRLITENVNNGEIVRLLVQGVQIPGGPIVKVSESTARRDVDAVEAEFADLFPTEAAADAEIGKCYEVYTRISVDAAKGPRPQYHAAITATDRRVKIAASRSSRWRHLAGPLGAPPGANVPELEAEAAARVAELAGMDDAELEKHHRRLVERANLLGLEVHPGGNVTAKRTG